MNFKFDVLKRPLESELCHEDRTKPTIGLFVVSIVIIFILPFLPSSELFTGIIMLPLMALVMMLRKSFTSKSQPEVIQDHVVDELIIYDKPFRILNRKKEIQAFKNRK